MSLKLLRAIEVTNLGSTLAVNSGIAGLASILGSPCATASSEVGDTVYLQSRDRIYTLGFGPSAGANTLFKLDPDFVFTSPGDGVFAARGTGDAAGAPGQGILATGQYNPSTGQQPLYFTKNIGVQIVSVNPDTLVVGSGPAFTGPNGAYALGGSDVTAGMEGNWSVTGAGSVKSRVLFFEGLTEGIPGETLLTGPGAYPLGLVLQNVGSCLVGGLSRNNIFGWIDARTRRIVGQLGGFVPVGFPARAMSGPTALQTQTENPIAGEAAFSWCPAQFLPDADSGYTQPKGQLYMAALDPLPSGSNSIVDPVPGDVFRYYVRFIDFNPFNLPSAQGIPTRTHGRIRLTSRAVVQRSPILGVAGAEEYRGFTNSLKSAFDPLRQRVVCFAHRNASPYRVQVGDNYVGLFSLVVDPVIISAPAARAVPRTGGVTEFECFVGGDLGEPSPGVNVSFSLARRSTEGELLTISGGIGTTSTVAHPAIDTDATGTADLTVTADGVPLAVTTDYTVVAATGVLTWVTSQVGKVVLASYKHRATDALPAHATLLIGQSQADENGVARTQVAFADDDTLVGTIDALTSTLA